MIAIILLLIGTERKILKIFVWFINMVSILNTCGKDLFGEYGGLSATLGYQKNIKNLLQLKVRSNPHLSFLGGAFWDKMRRNFHYTTSREFCQ